MGVKKPGRNKNNIKKYYESGNHDANMRRKKDRHIQRKLYFKARNEKFAIIIPQALKQFLSAGVVSTFRSNVDKNNYAATINKLADALILEAPKTLPRGRVKQELRAQLPKP